MHGMDALLVIMVFMLSGAIGVALAWSAIAGILFLLMRRKADDSALRNASS